MDGHALRPGRVHPQHHALRVPRRALQQQLLLLLLRLVPSHCSWSTCVLAAGADALTVPVLLAAAAECTRHAGTLPGFVRFFPRSCRP